MKGDAIGVVVHPRRDSHDHIECVVRWADGPREGGARARGGARPDAVVGADRPRGGAGAGQRAGDRASAATARSCARSSSPPSTRCRCWASTSAGWRSWPRSTSTSCRARWTGSTATTSGWRSGRRCASPGSIDGLPLTAFNDSALSRVPGHGPAALAVEVEGDVFARYTADALVIATPTGSTAYSFAAGGPIVSPRHRGLLVTPVAPHAAFDRAGASCTRTSACACTCSTARRRCCWRPTASAWPRLSAGDCVEFARRRPAGAGAAHAAAGLLREDARASSS